MADPQAERLALHLAEFERLLKTEYGAHLAYCNADHAKPIGSAGCVCSPIRLERKLAAAEARSEALLQALKRYGNHDLVHGVKCCAVFDGKPCNCGLDEILSQSVPKEKITMEEKFTKEEIGKGLVRAQELYEGWKLDELDIHMLYEAIVQMAQREEK